MNIFINNKEIEIVIKHTKRKTVSFKILRYKCVQVTAPYFLSEGNIIDIINKNISWIEKNIDKNITQKKERKYLNGDIIPYKGQGYTLKIKEGNREVIIDPSNFVINLSCKTKDEAKGIILNWYKKQAEEYIKNKVKYYEEILGVKSANIRIKNQNTLWGSCSSKRNLNFNLKIIMAPINIIDYVIIHELCHIKHMNHSLEFWKEVEKIIPDYKEKRTFLKNYGKNYYL